MDTQTTTAAPVKVTRVDTEAQIDPYRANTGGLTVTAINIDPESRTVMLYQNEPGNNGTPSRVWHGIEIDCRIADHHSTGSFDDGTERHVETFNVYPDADAARAYLEGDEAQAMLATICDGHRVEWDGNNHVGRRSDKADAALFELLMGIDALPEGPTYWTAEEWLGNNTDDEIGISATTTDEEIAILAEEMVTEAKADDILIRADEIAEYMQDRRNELIAEIESDEENE